MSNSPDSWTPPRADNPYADSQLDSTRPFAPAAPRESMPTFAMVMFIVSLIFSVLRAPMVLLSIVALMTPRNVPQQLAHTVPMEVATGVAVVLFGIVANTLLLLRKPIGIPFAWCLVAAVLASMGLGIWQISLNMEVFPEGSPQRVGMVVGAGFVMLLRLAIVGLYVAAVMMFSKWLRSTATWK